GEHHGRIVKSTGDGFLAEFGSVVDAVRCAVEVQRGMAEDNAAITPKKRIDFRIGVNLGDVIVDEQDIFGDGVNVAARRISLTTCSAGCFIAPDFCPICAPLMATMGQKSSLPQPAYSVS